MGAAFKDYQGHHCDDYVNPNEVAMPQHSFIHDAQPGYRPTASTKTAVLIERMTNFSKLDTFARILVR